MSSVEGTPTALAVDAAAPSPAETATATFGMGCFWGPDARFGAMAGVVRTRVGYAGGTDPDPSYYSLGDHTEVVQVEYDPARLDYEDLLEVFWANHNPFSSPHKRQYRGVVLVHDGAQRAAAESSKAALADRRGQAVETPVVGDELVDLYGPAVVDSTVAAGLNGFVTGHGSESRRDAFLADVALSPAAIDELRRRF